MNFNWIFDWGGDIYARYPIFCYVAAAVLFILLIWKPAKVLKTALLVLILLAILSAAFFLIQSTNVGVQVKEQGLQKMEKSLE